MYVTYHMNYQVLLTVQGSFLDFCPNNGERESDYVTPE